MRSAEAGVEAERDADHHREQQGCRRIARRRRHALQDHLQGRSAEHEAVAEIAVQSRQEGEVLLPQRLIETERGDHALAFDLIGVGRDEDIDLDCRSR